MNSSEAKNIDIAKIFTDIVVVNCYTINLVCLFMDYTSLLCAFHWILSSSHLYGHNPKFSTCNPEFSTF